jgi:hypothetical protein
MQAIRRVDRLDDLARNRLARDDRLCCHGQCTGFFHVGQ